MRFRFPKHSKDRWIKAIQCLNAQNLINVTDNTRICSKHFLSTDFANGIIKKSAFPTIFPKLDQNETYELKNLSFVLPYISFIIFRENLELLFDDIPENV